MTEIYTIIAEESGERIDALLAREIDGLTRSHAARLIESAYVTLHGKPVKKNHRVREGDVFLAAMPIPEEAELLPENIPLDIVFEDDDLIVVNKQRGMVVHPAPGHASGTLVNALLYHCGDSLSRLGGENRPGIVHRIDKDTSGLIIVAKNDYTHRFLATQLAEHSLVRVYEAIACGRMKNDSGTIDAPIGRHHIDRKRMAVTERNSRPAVTHYEPIARYKDYTHLRCMLETGRTHQIRVHMAYIGHPLLGDTVYGIRQPGKGLRGQCLHSRSLRFIHPRIKKEMQVTSALPDYFELALTKLGPVIE